MSDNVQLSNASTMVMVENEVYHDDGPSSSFSLHGPEHIPHKPLEPHGHSLYDDIYALYSGNEIVDWSNKGLSTDSLTNDLRQLLQQRNPKAIILDNNAFSIMPDEFALPSVEVLNIASQFDSKRSSLNRKPVLQMLPESISRAVNLRDLRAANNGLSHLPETFAQLKHLSRVDLRCNRFREFPPELLALPSLRELNLNANYICRLPVDIERLSELETLHVANNKLEDLPRTLSKLSNLKDLSVRNNNIVQLPRELWKCTKLENGALVVSDNPLAYPPREIYIDGTKAIFEYLKQKEPIRATWEQTDMEEFTDCLDVSDQQLKCFELPTDVDMQNYQILNASKNELSELPDFPDSLPIKTLHLDENHFVAIPLDKLRNLKKLHTLSMNRQLNNNDGMSLVRLPEHLYHLLELTELFLASNDIAILPDNIYFLQNLLVLDVAGNKLTSLPENITKMSKLQVLLLSKNALEELPASLGDLQQLLVLSVSTNKLRQLPDSICHIIRLQTLSLQGNVLRVLPLQFYKLTNLTSDKEHEITGHRFPAGCILDNNPQMILPGESVVKQGLQAVFNELMFHEKHPHLMDRQLPGQHTIRGSAPVHTLTDAYLGELSVAIGEQWYDVGVKLQLEKSVDLDNLRASSSTSASPCDSPTSTSMASSTSSASPCDSPTSTSMASSTSSASPDSPTSSESPGTTDPCLHMLTIWRNTSKNREEVMLGKLARAFHDTGLTDIEAEIRSKISPA